MVPGFKMRLLQEIKHLINTLPEYNDIQGVQEYLSIHESCFPPNCIVWAGASILSSLNCEVDKFEVTQKDYIEKYNQETIPDRFGEAYLFGTRDSLHFNRDFEEFMRAQKNMIFSSTTPYSTRSYTSKREPIEKMLQKMLRTMD